MALKIKSKVTEVKKFGTFGGVLTPNILTILGVVLFLRCGWVVGQSGLIGALAILAIGTAITLLTSLSLSAIATNTKTEGGGAYFLVSRSLGIEAGSSIGVPLFLAQAVSVGFYIIGFTESIQFLYPNINAQVCSTIVLAVLFIIAWIGAGFAIKAQYLILSCLVGSLASFFWGYDPIPDISLNLQPHYTDNQTFWTVFAIFFPAVTGIMAGVSMSGDLKEPSKSIPKGTISAVIITSTIYGCIMYWFALNTTPENLISNNLAILDIARFPKLIFLGLWAASLSSALASLVAAPRTLQALARDRLIPRIFARGSGPQKEPRTALVVSFTFALICIWAGSLNLIAPIISMFFLATYGMVNLTAAIEHWTSNPSYRPTLKIHWVFSALGAIACLWAMFMLNPLAAVLAFVVIALIYFHMARRSYQTSWGNSWSGFWFSFIRMGLMKLSGTQKHINNWRTIILVLMGNPKYRTNLIRFAELFEAKRGLLFLGQIAVGDWQQHLARQKGMQNLLDDYIQENGLCAVSKTILADSFEHGATALMQISGIGRLRPNTILMEWHEDWIKNEDFAQTIRHILSLERNLIIYCESELKDATLHPYIDVWWSAKENGSMMLTLAYLLQSNRGWRNVKIRLNRIIKAASGKQELQEATEKFLKESRIKAEIKIIVDPDTLPLDIITRESKHSIVTFIGASTRVIPKRSHPFASYMKTIDDLQGHTFLTKNWHDLEL